MSLVSYFRNKNDKDLCRRIECVFVHKDDVHMQNQLPT